MPKNKINQAEVELYKERLLPKFETDKEKKEAESVIRKAVELGYSNLQLWDTGIEGSSNVSIRDLVGVTPEGHIRFLYLN